MKKGTKYSDADTLVCLVKSKNDFSIFERSALVQDTRENI